jgi:hypothetical protein
MREKIEPLKLLRNNQVIHYDPFFDRLEQRKYLIKSQERCGFLPHFFCLLVNKTVFALALVLAKNKPT